MLLYALAFLLGIVAQPICLIPAAGLVWIERGPRLFLALLVALAGYFWQIAEMPDTTKEAFVFSPSSIVKKTLHGKTLYFYRGGIEGLTVDFSSPFKMPMDRDWFITGKLSGKKFKPDPNHPWKEVVGTFRLAEWRFQLKEKVRGWIERSIEHPRVASLLGGLATGEFDDRMLTFDFGRFGLSHLLAISGFHFALFASFLATAIRPFTNPKRASWVMIGLLGAYFLFLGDSPSVMRAFVTLFIFLFSPLMGEASRAENSLGGAALLALLLNPSWAFSIAFQLSFLSTGAILILFPIIDEWIKRWLIPRKKAALKALGWHQRGGLSVLVYLRKALSLNLAIMIPGIPVLFTLFHQFPFLSLVYNLFFPLLISLSLFLLILSILFPWLHPLNSCYTNFILHMTHELPPSWDWTLHTRTFTPELSLLIVTIIFVLCKRSQPLPQGVA